MRSRHALHLILFVPLLFILGCSSNNKGKIEGTKWSSQAATVKGKSIPAGVLQLEFRSDGSMVYGVGPQAYTGRYSLGAGDSVTLNLDQDLAGRKVHSERISISGDLLTMTDSDGTQLTFKKMP